MQYLTRRELEEIARQIAALGVKDTDFVWAEDLTEDDIFAIVQDGINKKYKLADFKDMIDQSAVEAALRAFAEEFKKTYDELLAIVDQLVIDANKDFQEDIELLVNSLKIQVADLEGNVSQLIMRSDLIEARVANAEGDLAILSIRADEIAAEVSNAEGDIARLSVRADEISGRVSNAEGDVAVLSIRADEISSQVSNLAGDVSLISQRADSITTQVSDIEGNVSQLQQTALGFETRVSNVEGDLSIVTQRADQISSQVSNLEGDMSLISQRADEIEARVQNNEGDIASIDIRADQIESRVSNAEGDISILHQTAQEFGTLITDMEGNMSSLTQTVNGVEVRVADVEGNVSVLEQTSTSLSSRITNAEGDISVLTQTAEGFATAVSNLEGDVSAISQRADSIDARVTNTEGDVAGLTIRADMIQSAVEDAEGNISLIQQTSEQIQSVVANQQGEISAITQRADSIESQVSNQQGQISIIRQTADEIQSVVANQQGQISGITQRADLIDLQVANINGDVAELSVRADEIESTVKNAEGDIAVLQQTAEGFDMRVSNVEGDVGQLILTAEDFDVRMADAEGNIGQLELTASSLNSRISNAEGDLSLISQDIDSIEFRVQNTEGDLSLLAVDVDGIKASVQNVSSDLGEYEDYVNGVLEGIQEQIDGAIDTWFYNGTPTLNNLPASDWTTTELKDMHLGDVYYDNETGYAYRFTKVNGVYTWTEITDSAVVDALAKARKAQDTADGKRRVFVYSESHPTPYAPYDPGDLWVRPIQITVPGDSQPTNTTVLYRCITGRAENSVPAFVESEWGPADEKALVINRANLQVLSDSIVGEVSAYIYDSNGIIDSATQSRISQTANAIRLSVSNQAIGTALGEGGSINDTLLDTGIDITNGDITLTANHINLRNQNAVSGLQMITVGTGANQKVVIKVDSLDVAGVFTTQAWTDANTAALNTFYTNQVAPIASDLSDLETTVGNIPDLSYLKAATNNGTLISGGLVLTSLIQLGGVVGGQYQVMSGINGIADTTATGNGIAAWYGGPMVDKQDHLSDNPMPDHALTLFRMDGSGYLADRNIWWDEDGNLTVEGYVLTDEIRVGYYDSANPPVFHLMAGLSGVRDNAAGHGGGVAAWYGGEKKDAFTLPNWATLTDEQKQDLWNTEHYARSLFRQDGSGYLANGEISWGDTGSVVIHGATLYDASNNQINISDLIELKSWFEKVSYIDENGNSRWAIRLVCGSAAGTIGGFYADGFISAGGLSPGSGSGGADLPAVWASLEGNSDAFANQKINAYHIPIGTGLEIQNGLIVATNSGTVTGVSLAQGATNGTLHLVVNGTAQSDVAVTGLGSMAYKSSLAFSEITGSATISQVSGLQSALDAKANSTALANYLPLTGGTIKNGNAGTPLTLDTTSETIGIYFATSATSKAWVGYQPTYGSVIYSQASSKYLGIKDDGTPHYQGNTLWHAGNDGASSGLDADLLDGQHGSYYATASSVTTLQGYFTNGAAKTARALSTLSADGTTWYDTQYPVIAKWDDSTHLRLKSQNAAGTVSYDVRVNAADKFVTARTLWGQSFDGTANVSGAMTGVTTIAASGQVEVGSLKLTGTNATPTLSWDASASAWKLTGNFYATGFISAGGVSSSGGSGGIDADAMWGLLANTDSTKKINVAHLPYSAGTGISLNGTTISLASGVCTAGTYYKTTVDTYGRVTTGYYADLSAAINGDLGIGTSNPTDADYYIAQYAGGGTTTTSYHRRPHSALYSYINTKLAAAHAGLDKVGTVTKVSTGTGLTGGDITSTGTISINSTYQTYITNGNTAHGWGNHASAGYVKLNPGASEQTLQSSISTLSKGVINLWRSSGDHYTFLGFSNGTTETLLGGIGFKSQSDANLYRRNSSGAVYKIWDEENLTKTVVTNLIGTTTYAAYNANGYLPLTGGTIKNGLVTGPLTLDTDSAIEIGLQLYLAGVRKAWVGYNTTYGAYLWNAASNKYLGIKDDGTPHYHGNTIYHSGNSNKSDVAWSASSLTLAGAISGATNIDSLIYLDTTNSRVGIGTSSPSYKLDVAGQSAAYGFTTRYDLSTLMSSAGWYTVFTALNTNATSQTVILQIRRNYHNANNETYTVSVNVAYNGMVSFTQISGCANTQLIDKIRVDYVNSGTTTIAIHYTGTVANTVFISGIGDGTFCAPTAVSSVNGTAVEFALKTSGISTNGNVSIENVSTYNNVYFRTADATLKMYVTEGATASYGKETVAIQTAFDTEDPETSTFPTSYGDRCVLALQPRGGNVGIGTTSPSQKLHVVGSARIDSGGSSEGVLQIVSAAGNGSAGHIMFYSNPNQNGFKIASVYSNWAARQDLVFYRSNNETAPYTFTPVELMRLTYNGQVKVTGNIIAYGQILGNSFEFNPSSSAGNGGYIDFHYNGSTADYTSRIIENASGRLAVTGQLAVTGAMSCASLTANGYVYANRTSTAAASFIHNKSGSYWSGIGYDGTTNVTRFGPCDGTGVWTASPAVTDTWKFIGNVVATGAITAGAASDARLKTNISTLSDSDAKALIMALRPVTFTWNDKATELYDQYNGDDLGFVAQEVENVLPVAIGTIFEKYKRLDQTKFIAPLVAVAKDHETRIEKLERENRELRKEVERLRMN